MGYIGGNSQSSNQAERPNVQPVVRDTSKFPVGAKEASNAPSLNQLSCSTVSTVNTCQSYLTKYIKRGVKNDISEVKNLQRFLKAYEGFTTLEETGVYDEVTYQAVLVFQKKYEKDILGPWNVTPASGYVYKMTLKKVNELYCIYRKQETVKGGVPTSCPLTRVTPICRPYLTKYIKKGAKNDTSEVKKLQDFLRTSEGMKSVSSTGIYDQNTFDAVHVFQMRYAGDVLQSWNANASTGYVYQTTLKKVNELYCQRLK